VLTPHDEFDPRWFSTHSWALVDAVWRAEIPATWPAQPVAPSFLGDDTARCPVLIDLRELEARDADELMSLLDRQVAQHESTICSLLLQSAGTGQGLLRHLSARIAIAWPGNPTPRQWRYFDPGTFVQLPRVIGPQGMGWLMGPMTSVLTPWAGQWAECRPALPPQGTPFKLGEGHRQALLALGAVNRVAMGMPPPAGLKAWLARCEQIEQHVLRAQASHGLRHQADLVAFAGHAMACHPEFDAHPVLLQLLARLRAARPEDELDYRELSATLGPEDWMRIRSDLESQVPSRQDS
jgi:hypothetical protein